MTVVERQGGVVYDSAGVRMGGTDEELLAGVRRGGFRGVVHIASDLEA